MILMVKNYLTACTKNNIIFAAKSEMASLGQIIVPWSFAVIYMIVMCSIRPFTAATFMFAFYVVSRLQSTACESEGLGTVSMAFLIG